MSPQHICIEIRETILLLKNFRDRLTVNINPVILINVADSDKKVVDKIAQR